LNGIKDGPSSWMRRERRTFRRSEIFASVGEHPKSKHKGEHNNFSTDRGTRKLIAIELLRTLDLHNT
jgi:hypothetical protein